MRLSPSRWQICFLVDREIALVQKVMGVIVHGGPFNIVLTITFSETSDGFVVQRNCERPNDALLRNELQ